VILKKEVGQGSIGEAAHIKLKEQDAHDGMME